MVEQTPHDEGERRSTLWSWCWIMLAPWGRSAVPRGGRDRSDTVTPPLPAVAASSQGEVKPTSVLLRFPIYGEALLVKLADGLRSRFADRGPESDPLLLTVSRCPGSRLTIDRSAYVEFDSVRGAFYVAIEAESDTRVFLETTDFDTLVSFVVQYITERPSEPAALEAAS